MFRGPVGAAAPAVRACHPDRRSSPLRVMPQNLSFKAICRMRGARAPVMRPKLPEVTVVSG